MKLLCLKCNGGPIKWDDPEVKSLDDDMTCQECGFIYHGMGNYSELAMGENVSRMIPIKSCQSCPHCDHSGAFTIGGAWPVCHGPEVVDWGTMDINYNDPDANTKWSPPILPVITKHCRSYNGKIPEWCPLPKIGESE